MNERPPTLYHAFRLLHRRGRLESLQVEEMFRPIVPEVDGETSILLLWDLGASLLYRRN